MCKNDNTTLRTTKRAHHTIILIDGTQLSELMLQYNVGVQVKTTFEVKEIDHDFFEED